MSRVVTFLAVFASCACTFGQSFECSAVGPLPTDPAISCDGVVSNGLGIGGIPVGATGVVNVPSCGFPTAGSQFLRITGNGPGFQPPTNLPFNPPVGGPFPRPVPALVTEVRIPIPAGATTISMDWDFFSQECPGVPPTNTYYDGMSIDVVSAGGTQILNLAYADTATGEGSCTIGTDYCGGPLSESVPVGPNPLVAVLPALSGCEYISIVVWNGNDNAYPSCVYLDNVQFNTAAPGCPVPCFIVGAQPPALQFSSPGGPGCLLVTISNLQGNGQFFMPVTLNPGAFPNGWLFGIDIGFPELAAEINAGFPFQGGLIGTPCSQGSAVLGQFCGLPSGLSLYAVALGFSAGSSYPSMNTPAVTYTIP